MSNLVMWIKDKIPQAAFNNDELREAIKSLRSTKEYKDDINSIQYFKENRAYIEQTLNIKPIKEFGTNYAEHYHSGESAIAKLINEAQAHKESGAKGEYKGQVAGAFHRKELGDIDLVWGEVTDFEKHKGYGLAHIIDKRKAEFMQQGFSEAEAEQKALEFVKSLPDIIENGNIDKSIARAFLETQDSKAVIALDFNDKDNKWILTAYNKDDALNPAYSHQVKHNTNTSSETRASGDNNIIPQTPQTKPYEVNENGRKYIEIPDDELADFEKPIKEALLLELRQQELLKKINADSKDIDSYAEFMTNERKIMKGHEFTFNQQQEGLADRFLNMANSLENPRDRNRYAENILANMKDDIEKVYKGNASEFLAREAEKPFYKQMDKIRKETDEIVEALNKERDRLHAEKETQLKAQQEAEKTAEIERIANYDLETAYKEKAHLEKIMQSNRNDYSPYGFSPAHNSEFLDKLDLVEQRIRDLKNKLPNKTPQENKPSKVEALKDFIDNARFQVNYAKKAGGTDTALKLIQQMIKDTNNTYEAKFLYRLKNEVSALKGTESSTQINKDSVMFSGSETSHLNGNKDVLALPQHDKGINQYDKTKETFTDSYGKTHEIPKDIAQAWKNTFNLQSLDEAYIPNFTPEVKQALDSILQGEDIKLSAGSLVKLMQRDRLEFLPYIKDTLEHSDIIIKDKENAIIFAKDIGQTSYFTSVSKNDKGEWVISTNSYKTLSQLKNRVNDNGEILYISKEAPNILAETFTTKAFSNELANAIIPQTPQEIVKQARKSGKSVAETKELLQKHKDIESKRKETQKLITQEKKAKENLHKEIGIFEKEKQNALEKLETIKTQINELEKKDLSSKQAQKQMDKLQTNLSFFANEIEKTRNLIKQRKDKLATTQEVYIPQNHTFSYDGREFNTREHFSILKQRSLNNQDDDFNGFDTLMREAIENALNIKPIKEFGTNYAEHYHGRDCYTKATSRSTST